jgi:SCP1.201-like deaminase
VRKFVVAVVIAVLAWIFVVPSCSTTFGCESAPATAHADSGSCPDDIDDAAEDADWAADRIASIKDEPITTGLLYDEDGYEQELDSKQSGPHFDLALTYLRPLFRNAARQAAGHVEAKAAALMRNADMDQAVLVINNPRGVCDYAAGIGCDGVVEAVLPEGTTLVVWWPGGMHRALTGKARS